MINLFKDIRLIVLEVGNIRPNQLIRHSQCQRVIWRSISTTLMLHTRNTCIDNMQVRRPIFRAPANVGVSQRFNMRSDSARSVSIAHALNVRLNISIAIQICGVEVYASIVAHSTEEGAPNEDGGSKWTSNC